MDRLAERLLDLAHDFGKYLRLPITMLPHDANDAEVRRALHHALCETRRAGTCVQSARTIWRAFERELAPQLGQQPAWRALEDAVERALGWEVRLYDDAPLDRAALEADLRAVGRAIEAFARRPPRWEDGPRR